MSKAVLKQILEYEAPLLIEELAQAESALAELEKELDSARANKERLERRVAVLRRADQELAEIG